MAHKDYRCPHCNGQIKIVVFNPHDNNPRGKTYRSTQPTIDDVPRGWLSSLLWYLSGFGDDVQDVPVKRQVKYRVAVEEVSRDKKHWSIKEFSEGVDNGTINRVAELVIDRGVQWSRNKFEAYGISQTRFHKLSNDMVRLGYLDRSMPNRSTLTPLGLWVLRSINSNARKQQQTTTAK